MGYVFAILFLKVDEDRVIDPMIGYRVGRVLQVTSKWFLSDQYDTSQALANEDLQRMRRVFHLLPGTSR